MEGTPTEFPKASNKYPRPKSVLESQVRPLRVKIISVDKTNLWFDWTGILSSGMSVTSPSVHTQSRRVHIKPAKSEEDNRKKEKKNIFQVLLPHQGQRKTPTCLFYGQFNKNCHLFSFLVCQRWETSTPIQLCEGV